MLWLRADGTLPRFGKLGYSHWRRQCYSFTRETQETTMRILSENRASFPVYIRESSIHGVGVFASKNIEKNEIVELCPSILIPKENIPAELQDHYFSWGIVNSVSGVMELYAAIPMGCGMLYNHSRTPNVAIQVTATPTMKMNQGGNFLLSVQSLTNILKDDEICIDYGEEWWRRRRCVPLELDFARFRQKVRNSL